MNRGNFEVVELLIENGADQTMCDSKYGQTALTKFIRDNRSDFLQIMAVKGLQLNA